ncbi:LuxR family transcriptional regulator [Flammeovirgaceae bacterium 311]|nr:LuxR family transcriptional regulator [Flammeovirgaceae bacterium 311]
MNKKAIFEGIAEEMRKLSVDPNGPDRREVSLGNMEQFNDILSAGPVIVSVFNNLTFKFDYISPNVEPFLGVSPEDVIGLGREDFMTCYIHPEDLEIVGTKLIPELVNFLINEAKGDILNYSVHYNYRMKAASGKWIKIEQQTSPLKADQHGMIQLEQNFCTQVGKADFDELYPIKLNITCRNSAGVYESCFSRIFLQKKIKAESLTPREFDILKLLAAGKTSGEIANALHISEATTITHRRNMLQKLNLKNTSELIVWAFHSGLL